jgi:hypothetical protein
MEAGKSEILLRIAASKERSIERVRFLNALWSAGSVKLPPTTKRHVFRAVWTLEHIGPRSRIADIAAKVRNTFQMRVLGNGYNVSR